jgi:PAS domain S-box-containing protein
MGYSVANMARSPSDASFFDRVLLLPEEAKNPDRRYAKSLFLFVLLGVLFVEVLLTLTAAAVGKVAALAVHGDLAVLILASMAFLRTQFRPWAFAVGVWIIGWTASTLSLLAGFGIGALLWHLFFPAAILILRGEKWGFAALAADMALAVVHALWFLPEFAFLAGPDLPPLLWIVGWELGSCFIFVLFLLFLRLMRNTLATYQAERGRTMDLLTETKDSEARWADQVRFLETLMDVIPFPLFHKGTDGKYISANAAFRVVFDVPRDRVTGHTNDAFLNPENAATLAKIEGSILAKDSMVVEEAVLVHADGQPHSFIVYVMPFVDDHHALVGSIGVLIDITERKAKESALVRLNATKDQLFSIISHDLRGPVGKLKQLLDIYIDDPGIFDKATWDQVFHDMRRSTDSLFQLLENLLSWARAQQGNDNVRYESVPLAPVVTDVFAVFKLLALDKRVSLEANVNLPVAVLTDRHVLSTILRNLVHNALKFSNPGGKITVTAEETPDDLWIEVKDNGVGMAPETLQKIFQKRERITTFGTGKEKGQGIGLGLCQDLAASLGSHLEATSQPGVGTAIRLHLPTPEL